MNILQLEEKLQNLTDNLSKEEFIFDFLSAYEMPKASVSRLRKNSDVNTLEQNGELTVKNKKLFFKNTNSENLNATFEELLKSKKSMRFVLVTDFTTLMAFDSKLLTTLHIPLSELSKNSDFFWALAGVEKATVYAEKEADVKASLKMAKLFDEIQKTNAVETQEDIHALNVFLTRLLFCYFAEDTQIFEGENAFSSYVESVSNADGSDVDIHIERLFEVLNSQNRDISNHLKKFPYVNGGLFRDKLRIPTFNAKSRKLLLECGRELNWSQINPDIFGSMIQAVISDEHRGGNGMHYTSVPNIMKVINPLFLEELNAEYESVKTNAKKLNLLHKRITNIKIFDPACGSGNFLIIAYKELRRLEMKIFKSARMLNMPSIKLSQFYGIELDDFAHEVAILSLWLTEHQMNMEFKQEFGDCTPTLPLQDGGNIIQGNATRLEWSEVCPKEDGDEIYVLGNPPYLGYSERDAEQKEDMNIVFKGLGNVKRVDYIGCWFKIASDYIQNINAKYAFVSTNSISQGEQVGFIFPYILSVSQEIGFAHQSFKWKNNAKDNAGVSVVVVGIRNINQFHKSKILYLDNISKVVKNISPYLTEGVSLIITQRKKTISKFPEMQLGSSGIDGGHLLLTPTEKQQFVDTNPSTSKFIKKYMGGNDFLKDMKRYCLWIDDDSIDEANSIADIKNRVDKCYEYRINAGRDAKKAANVPHRFFYRKHKAEESIILPMTSSENRNYLPVGIADKNTILSNGVFMINSKYIYMMGILSSSIHLLWVHTLTGRLESRIRYSVNLVYNTFPFPKITQTQKENIEELVHLVLDERDKNFPKTMAELYDPEKMPEGLKLAHHNLDMYIEKCYREKPFESDEERLEYLFKLYEKMIKEEVS